MAQAVRIGKKKYAVGLSWGPLSPDRPLRPQAIEKARQSKDTLYVIYGEVEPMVGHCEQKNGVRARMPCLAPIVAEIWPANTLLALVLDENQAIGIQITNGNIYDDAFGSPEEIRSWFDSLVGERTWDFVSSPWGPGEYHKESFFDQLADKAFSPPKLRSVNENRGMAVRVGILGLVTLLIFISVSAVLRHRREMEERLAWMSRHVIRKVIPPAQLVPLEPFVESCRKALDRIPAFSQGWDVRAVSCRPDRIRISWVREDVSAGTVRELEKDLGTPVSLTGENRARTDFPLSVPSRSVSVDRLPALSDEKKDLVSVLERYGLKYQMEAGSFLPGMESVSGSGSEFSVDLPDLPRGRFLADLGRVSGLSAQELRWSGKTRWILKGEMKHAPVAFKNRRISPGIAAPVPSGAVLPPNGKSPSSSSGKSAGSGGNGQFETLRPPEGTSVGGPGLRSEHDSLSGSKDPRDSNVPPVHFAPGH